MKARVVTATAITVGTTQDIIIPGFGPVKGYMVIATLQGTDATERTNGTQSFGFCDGTRSRAFSMMAEDNNSVNTNSFSRINQSEVIGLLDETTGDATMDGLASHDSFIPDGVRINWSNLPSNGGTLQFMFFGGDDLEIEVNNDTHNQSVDTAVEYTLIGGFQPDVVLFTGHAANGQNAVGFAMNSGGATENNQGNVNAFSRDGTATTQGAVSSWNSKVINWNNNGGNPENEVGYLEFTSFLSNGFSLTKRITGQGSRFMYMALRSSTNRFFVGNFGTPTGTGKQASTGIGFRPQAVALFGNGQTTINTITASGDEVLSFSYGFFDNSVASTIGCRDDDGVTTSNTAVRWDQNTAYHLIDGDGTTMIDASFTSMDTDGFTLNYATNDALSRQWFVFAVEETRRVMVMTHRRHRA